MLRVFAFVVGIAIGAYAQAENCYTSNIGSTTCVRCSDGSSSTNTNIGSSTFTNGTTSDGESYRSNTTHIGSSSFTNGATSDGTSFRLNSTRIGGSTFTNGSDSDGGTYNGNSLQIGNSIFTNGSYYP